MTQEAQPPLFSQNEPMADQKATPSEVALCIADQLDEMCYTTCHNAAIEIRRLVPFEGWYEEAIDEINTLRAQVKALQKAAEHLPWIGIDWAALPVREMSASEQDKSDPCPACQPGSICKKPTCGRLVKQSTAPGVWHLSKDGLSLIDAKVIGGYQHTIDHLGQASQSLGADGFGIACK